MKNITDYQYLLSLTKEKEIRNKIEKSTYSIPYECLESYDEEDLIDDRNSLKTKIINDVINDIIFDNLNIEINRLELLRYLEENTEKVGLVLIRKGIIQVSHTDFSDLMEASTYDLGYNLKERFINLI